MILSKALDGFFMTLRAEGYSKNTISLYGYMLAMLVRFTNDQEVEKITPADLTHFFDYLQTDYPHEMNDGKPLSGSTLQNHWKAIRRFFRWAKGELDLRSRPDLKLKMPDNNPKIIKPLEEDEVKSLVESTEWSRGAKTEDRLSFRMRRATAKRDKALLIVLLDTGIRVGEAERLNISNLDFDNAEITIVPYGSSRRKTKSRIIPLGKSARRVLWGYIASRKNIGPDDPVFETRQGYRMNKQAMLQLVRKLGEKAGVENCHPNRLRHTFAIEYLRNDGDIFTLQAILGHSSLDMVRHYLQLATTDTKNAHRRASPADRWHL